MTKLARKLDVREESEVSYQSPPPPPPQFKKDGGTSLWRYLPLFIGLAVLSAAILVGIFMMRRNWLPSVFPWPHEESSSRRSTTSSSSTWFQSGPSKKEMDSDANIVCRAYSAQANAVNAFNQYIGLCNSAGQYYSDCNSYTAAQYRSNVETLKSNFSQQQTAFYNKYGFNFSDRYNCY